MATRELVAAPPRSARLGGIKAVANFVANGRLGATELVSFMANGCSFPEPAIGLCYGEVVAEEKTSTGIDIIDAISPPFALYAGVECWLGPDSASDYSARAQNLLSQGEDRILEGRLATWAGGGLALSPGVTITDSIATVDSFLDDEYPAQGVILMNRGDAVRAAAEGSLEPGVLDGVPRTINGTPVIATSYVTVGTVYGLGSITVLKSTVETINSVDVRLNKNWVVAEAVYAIIVDCDMRASSSVTPEVG